MDIIIDYDGNEFITYENCSICLEKLHVKENIHELQECKHNFHSNCLITYLRTGNTLCPLCRGKAKQYNPGNRKMSISAVLKYTKKKNANKKIKKIVEKYKNLKKKHIDCRKILYYFLKDLKNNKEYQEIIKKRSKLVSDTWKLRKNIIKIERELSNIVMLPIKF